MLNRIMLAIDGSPHSERSLEYTKALGEKFGSEVIVTHVVKRMPSGFGREAGQQTPEQAEQDVDVVGRPRERMTPEQAEQDVDVVGRPKDRATAEQLAQDIDVVGIPKERMTEEQRAWDREFFGEPGDVLLEQFETGQQLVDDYAAKLSEAGINASGELGQGLVADGILELAEANDCDVIVVGARGRGAAQRLLGSVSQDVVSKADIPVFVVH